MMSYISSSVTDISGSAFTKRAAKLPMADRTADIGRKMRIKKHSEPATAKDSRSLYFLAMLFGSISPTRKTTMVMIIVLRVTALSPQMRVTLTVTMLAAAMCTMFVQIRILLMARSKLSSTSSA